MPRHANQTSFKPGIDSRTGQPAMTDAERKIREKEYYQRHKVKTLAKNWVTQIGRCGWTPEEYNAAFERQGGVCFICLGTNYKLGAKRSRRLAADHCHKTGKRRHLLCNRCNIVLGLIEESPDLMRRMEEYLAQ